MPGRSSRYASRPRSEPRNSPRNRSKMKPDRPSKNLMTTLPRTASQTTTSARWSDEVLALDVADEVQVRSRRAARSRAGSGRRPCPSPRRSRAARRAGRATPRTRSAKIAPIRAYWARFSGVESGFAPMSRRTIGPASVIIWTASAGRSTPGRRPSRRTAAAMPAPVWPAVTTRVGARRCFTRSVATRIVASFFSRSASAGCSSMPMTWRGVDDRDVRRAASPAIAPDDRLVADEEEPVLGMGAGVVEARRARPPIGPWSPPIASTATRTPRRPLASIRPVRAADLVDRGQRGGRRSAAA